jgi:hypothetical protein
MEEPGHEEYTVFKEYKNRTAYEKMREFIMFVYERFGECDP